MTDLEQLLQRYIERFESGGDVDPSDVLSEVSGEERRELGALIDGYLELGAPAQAWDAKGFEGSLAETAMSRVAESWSTASGELPHALVDLRNAKKLKRSEVVETLSSWLGLKKQAQREKVAWYYHRLELGLLQSDWVSPKVFDGLAEIFGRSADELRRAGGSVSPAAGGEPLPALARMAPAAARTDDETIEFTRQDEKTDETDESDWDEVDRLFRGDSGG